MQSNPTIGLCQCFLTVSCCAAFARDGATPLLLPYSAEDHATIAIAAAAAEAAASSSAGAGTSSSSGRSWFGGSRKQQQQDTQQEHGLQEQQRQLMQQRLQEQKQQELYTAAVEVPPSDLRLSLANHFMPPDSVLELSEFSLPHDADTLDFYNWLLV